MNRSLKTLGNRSYIESWHSMFENAVSNPLSRMFSIFLSILLAVASCAAKHVDILTRRSNIPMLDDRPLSPREFSNTRLLPRTNTKNPTRQAVKPDSRTSSPPRSSSPTLPSISGGPRQGTTVSRHGIDTRQNPSGKQDSNIITKDSRKYYNPPSPTRKDPVFTKAKQLQKDLGLEKHLSPADLDHRSLPSIIKHEKWQKDVEHRVAEAKSKAIPGPRYQPMIVDKAKSTAKQARTRANQEYQTLSAWKPPERGEPAPDLLNRANGLRKAEGRRFMDLSSSNKYAKQHETAALKAKQDNRWNDVARHEQSAARQKARGALRDAKMRVLINDHVTAMGHLKGGRFASSPEEIKERKGVYASTLKVAGAQYKQARGKFDGSDSEEEVPGSPGS